MPREAGGEAHVQRGMGWPEGQGHAWSQWPPPRGTGPCLVTVATTLRDGAMPGHSGHRSLIQDPGSCLAPAGSGHSAGRSSAQRHSSHKERRRILTLWRWQERGRGKATSCCGLLAWSRSSPRGRRARHGVEAELSPARAGRVPPCPLANCCQAQVTLFFRLVRLLLLALFISFKRLKSSWEVTEGLEKQTTAALLFFLAFELTQLQILYRPQAAREHAGAVRLSRALAAAQAGRWAFLEPRPDRIPDLQRTASTRQLLESCSADEARTRSPANVNQSVSVKGTELGQLIHAEDLAQKSKGWLLELKRKGMG